MRFFPLCLSLFLILLLAGCGSEDDINPPTFSDIRINGSTNLSSPVDQSPVTISGRIDDSAASIVLSSLASGQGSIPVVVSNEGTWELVFSPLEGTNTVTFTATDDRGNINQMILTILYAPIAQ